MFSLWLLFFKAVGAFLFVGISLVGGCWFGSCVGFRGDLRHGIDSPPRDCSFVCGGRVGRFLEALLDGLDGDAKWAPWLAGGANFGGIVQKKQIRFSDASACGSSCAQRT